MSVDQTSVRVTGEPLGQVELALAARNHALPLEALAYDVTPSGLHYLLSHYDVPYVALDTWRLTIDGLVDEPLILTLDDLRARPNVTRTVTMECAGNGRALMSPRASGQPWLLGAVGNAVWTGTPLRGVLDDAGVQPDAVEVVFTGTDLGMEDGAIEPYGRSLEVGELGTDEILLVWGMNDAPLLPQHGAPLRLLVPGWYGMASVKWLTSITAVDKPFQGHHQVREYRLRQEPEEPGVPLGRMRVRSLMTPPGVPDYPDRRRYLDTGSHLVRGRAWSGEARIETVELSTNSGASWEPASLGEQTDPRCWREWGWSWRVREPGEYTLICRATDADGRTQPLTDDWNLGGYAANAVQRVEVSVR